MTNVATPAPQQATHFSCSSIRFAYGGRQVLSDVSVSAALGEVVGIAGPNGAGKTTLLDILTGRLKPSSGTVMFNNRDITRLSMFRRARAGIARTFQAPIVPLSLTVAETLRAAALAYPPYILDTLQATCEFVGFDSHESIITGTLGTLARRKLLLAGLLLRKPTVLLLDEPASGLLADEITALAEVIQKIAGQGVAIMIIEHRLELLHQLSKRMVFLHLGSIFAEGTPDQVLSHPAVKDVLLGMKE
jgi:branched-chain amino acid transport system ATP-binding protein